MRSLYGIGLVLLLVCVTASDAQTCSAAAGPRGATGHTGATGAAGPTGPSGADGAMGATGVMGPMGATGARGVTGTEGPPGRDCVNATAVCGMPQAGRNGTDGATGPAGARGIDGRNGTDGATGPAGPTGPSGADGRNGTDGATGPVGATGPSGIDGRNGTDGATGATGADGPPGRDGTNGTDGVDGRDGFNGTDGAVGPAGRDGINGTDGATGAEGQAGRDGLNGTDGATGAQGPAGRDGVNGTDGEVGATGPMGPPGRDGVNGTDGVDGRDGVNGTHGIDGVDGRDGLNGTDGATGPAGATGPMGPTGPAGPDGASGALAINAGGPSFVSVGAENGTVYGGFPYAPVLSDIQHVRVAMEIPGQVFVDIYECPAERKCWFSTFALRNGNAGGTNAVYTAVKIGNAYIPLSAATTITTGTRSVGLTLNFVFEAGETLVLRASLAGSGLSGTFWIAHGPNTLPLQSLRGNATITNTSACNSFPDKQGFGIQLVNMQLTTPIFIFIPYLGVGAQYSLWYAAPSSDYTAQLVVSQAYSPTLSYTTVLGSPMDYGDCFVIGTTSSLTLTRTFFVTVIWI